MRKRRTLWASGCIGGRPAPRGGNRLFLTLTTPAELVDVLAILDPFQAVAK